MILVILIMNENLKQINYNDNWKIYGSERCKTEFRTRIDSRKIFSMISNMDYIGDRIDIFGFGLKFTKIKVENVEGEGVAPSYHALTNDQPVSENEHTNQS